MAKGDLTQSELMEALSYDHDTGLFTWIAPKSTRLKPGQVAGNARKDGYSTIRLSGGRYLAHRLAWLYVHGEWPELLIDHINGDPSDNRFANLRQADHSTNGMNKAPSGKPGGRGVYQPKGCSHWVAEIKNQGIKRYLGSFPTQELARAAFVQAASASRGEFVRID